MRFWKFGLFLLCCSLFGLQGCTGAEETPVKKPERKPDASFVPSEIQKSEISILHNNIHYELIMRREREKILCTIRTMKSKFNLTPSASGSTGTKPIVETPNKKERIFPRGCSFTADETNLADLDKLLQKGGVTSAAATTEPAEFKQLRLAKDNGQKLYDGKVMLGRLLHCHYSSAGSMSGGHHFMDLTRKNGREALFESRYKAWHNSPEKTQNRVISAQLLDEMEALGREYKIDAWGPFPETDLIALDAATVSVSLSYGEPWSWVKWDLRMGTLDKFTKQQAEYYRKIQAMLFAEDKKG